VDRGEALALFDRLHAALDGLYGGGDAEPVRAVLSEDVEWHVPGRNAIAGDYQGIDAVLDYFAKRRDFAERTLRLHPGEILIGEEHIAVLTDGSATIGGVEHRWATVGLYRIREDRIAACWLLPLDPPAFDAVWSSP
jgi:ketosteroid isomerase-like protein